jgi:hypothetical protein
MTESLDSFTEILKENPGDIGVVTKLLKANLKVLCCILRVGIVNKKQKSEKSSQLTYF